MARAPDAAGVYAVRFGGGVAHLLERVAAVAEVVRPVGQGLKLDGLHLGAVLGAFEVPHLRDDAVDGAVEAGDLGMEAVDHPPEQALALVGELGPLDGDARDDDADGFGERLGGVVLVPDVAAVELAALGRRAVKREALADGCSSIESKYNTVFVRSTLLGRWFDHRITHQFAPEVTAPCWYNPPRPEWLERPALRETIGSSST